MKSQSLKAMFLAASRRYQMTRLWGDGMDTLDIAREMGLSEAEVYNALAEIRASTRTNERDRALKEV